MVGGAGPIRENPSMTEMQYQMWNWYNFHWLSGDQPGAQLIHCSTWPRGGWAIDRR